MSNTLLESLWARVSANIGDRIDRISGLLTQALSASAESIAARDTAVAVEQHLNEAYAASEAGQALPPYLTQSVLSNTYVGLNSQSVNVQDFGAKGDGSTDDTEAINMAILWASENGVGRVVIPAGTYMIQAHDPEFDRMNFMWDSGGIAVLSGIHLDMDKDTILKAIPNTWDQYNVIRVFDKHDVKITGGKIIGDLSSDPSTESEWGYGISIRGGENITVENVVMKECRGDGLNIQVGPFPPAPERPAGYVYPSPVNVLVRDVICRNNARHGMAVEAGIGVLVEDSIFDNNTTRAFSCGVDIEPFTDDAPLRDITFNRCRFTSNKSGGMLIMRPQANNITISRCVFAKNENPESQFSSFTQGKNIALKDNVFQDSKAFSILMQGGTGHSIVGNTCDAQITVRHMTKDSTVHRVSDVTISQNVVSTTALPASWGIYCLNADRMVISENTINVAEEAQGGLTLLSVRGAKISGNSIEGGQRGIWFRRDTTLPDSKDVVVAGNTVWAQRNAIAGDQVDTAILTSNIFYGPYGDAAIGGVVLLGSSAFRVSVTANVFYQEPLRTVTPTFRAANALQWVGQSDVVGSDNRLISDGASQFGLFDSGAPALGSGYVADGGVMSVMSSRRPTSPRVGTQIYDTTIKKLIIWDGAGWVDSTGTAA